ncbi:hypothetical protein L1887_18025 [Cichorium endivia]|nr:hypothetical protein L1887_18025 [Cichorium endivia]
MHDGQRGRSTALISKSEDHPKSDGDVSENSDADDEEYNHLADTTRGVVFQKGSCGFRTNPSGFRKTSSESLKSTSADKKTDGKYFNYGSNEDFTKDCKMKKGDTKEESYKRKKWEEEVESSDDEDSKNVCLMAVTEEVTEESTAPAQAPLMLICVVLLKKV